MQGQINLDSILGQYIYNYTKKSSTINILDIGSWNGLGSTMCVIKSLIDNPKKIFNFITIEANYKQYTVAKENLIKYTEYVDIYYGRLTDTKDLVSLDDYDDSFFNIYPKSLQQKWYEVDVEQSYTTPYIFQEILEQMTNSIDLVIFDGGEYCTHGEFLKLQSYSKILILDDTNTIKNYKNAEIIRKSNKYKIIEDNKYDRNGYLIAERLI